MRDFILALMFALPMGLVLGICIYFINQDILRIQKLKIWHSVLAVWFIIAIIYQEVPEFFETQLFQGVFAVTFLLGIICAYNSRKAKRRKAAITKNESNVSE